MDFEFEFSSEVHLQTKKGKNIFGNVSDKEIFSIKSLNNEDLVNEVDYLPVQSFDNFMFIAKKYNEHRKYFRSENSQEKSIAKIKTNIDSDIFFSEIIQEFYKNDFINDKKNYYTKYNERKDNLKQVVELVSLFLEPCYEHLNEDIFNKTNIVSDTKNTEIKRIQTFFDVFAEKDGLLYLDKNLLNFDNCTYKNLNVHFRKLLGATWSCYNARKKCAGGEKNTLVNILFNYFSFNVENNENSNFEITDKNHRSYGKNTKDKRNIIFIYLDDRPGTLSEYVVTYSFFKKDPTQIIDEIIKILDNEINTFKKEYFVKEYLVIKKNILEEYGKINENKKINKM